MKKLAFFQFEMFERQLQSPMARWAPEEDENAAGFGRRSWTDSCSLAIARAPLLFTLGYFLTFPSENLRQESIIDPGRFLFHSFRGFVRRIGWVAA